MDENTLLISHPICAKNGVESSYEYALSDLDGRLGKSIKLSEESNYGYIGPAGYFLFPAGHQGWLIFDSDLHPRGSLRIPPADSPGTIALSPSRTAVALSSGAAGSYSIYRWQLLAGDPLVKTGEYTGPLPFPGITDAGSLKAAPSGKDESAGFEVAPGDRWFFDEGNKHLLTRSVGRGESILHGAEWLVPESAQDWCTGVVSEKEPRRILAYCQTSHYLPRAVGGFVTHGLPLYRLRYVVYDANGGIITKGTYSFDSPPSLSPSGKVLMLPHGAGLIRYDLP